MWYISAQNEKGIYHHFVQIICSRINNIKKFEALKICGRFNRYISTVNAVMRTAPELYTHHYVWPDDLPSYCLNKVLLHITVIEMLTIM